MNDVATVDSRPPIVVLRDRLEARRGEIQAALVDVKPEHFIRAVITSATINPDLLACSWQSLWLACMRACRDGLLPDGRQGAIVPYKSTATWIPMYQGLIMRAWRSGMFRWIGASVVREGDGWTHYTDTTGEHFRHDPVDDGDTLRPIVRIYAAATTITGGTFIAVLPLAEANKIRNESRATREDSPWKKWESEMYKKTALRRLAKLLPTDILDGDDEVEAPPYEPATVRVEPPRSTGGAAALDAFAGSGRAHNPTPDQADAVDQPATPSTAGDGPAPETRSQPDAGAVAEPLDPPETDDQRERREAYERGKGDKARGVARKACPPEYRDNGRIAMAWTMGWLGEPFPVR